MRPVEYDVFSREFPRCRQELFLETGSAYRGVCNFGQTQTEVETTLIESNREATMSAKKERWKELCEQASTEQDPTKLALLVDEINFLLAATGRHPKNELSRRQEPRSELRCE